MREQPLVQLTESGAGYISALGLSSVNAALLVRTSSLKQGSDQQQRQIQNNVSVYDNVTLEDDVFCGPSMVFTNVYNRISCES